MDFFVDCKSPEELKNRFRKLSKCFHPDKGGDTELFMELKKQHDSWSSSYAAPQANQSFYSGSPHTNEFPARYSRLTDGANAYVQVLKSQITHLNKVISNLQKQVDWWKDSSETHEKTLQSYLDSNKKEADIQKRNLKEVLEKESYLKGLTFIGRLKFLIYGSKPFQDVGV